MRPHSSATTEPKTLVQVVPEACNRIARWVKAQDVPIDREETSLPGFSADLIGNFFLPLVAICHQTSPRGLPALGGRVNGTRLRGWDYLSARLEVAARMDPSLLTPERWSQLSGDDIRELFHDPSYGYRLTDPEGRAQLLCDLGSRMMANGWYLADHLYEHCNHRIASGEPNLLEVLSKFHAYRDPVHKKSYFFLALMRNSGRWIYPDDEALGPPVDYHEVRGHLRLGTVRIADSELLDKVRSGLAVSESQDLAIRQAVHDAVMYISKCSRLNNPSQLHYLFWNLFRSVCTREAPQCFATRPGFSLPERYMGLVESDHEKKCPFAGLCASAGQANPICEHVFETDYY